MLQSILQKAVARFKRDEDGSIAIETVIIIPVLFWAYLSMFAIFDAYRHHALNQKAGYTIGDMISRETNPIDQTFMVGAKRLLEYLTLSDPNDTAIRVSSIKYDEEGDTYEKHWSKTHGSGPIPLTDTDIANLHNRLPTMKDNEYIVVVESWVEYDPPFDTGLATHDMVNFVFTRPRYAPSVLWAD